MKHIAQLIDDAVKHITEKPNVVTHFCAECQKPFDVPDDVFARYRQRCDSCVASEEARLAAGKERRRQREREAKWSKLCPPGFQTVDSAKLPNPAAFDRVLAWQYGSLGLLLHGDTGRGKSWAAWTVLKREFMAGRNLLVLDSSAGIRYASCFSQSGQEAEKWLNDHILIDILFCDDIFKVKSTDSFENAVFTLIDQRMSWQRPTIITTNDTGETLAGRMSADRSGPFLRRLRECCRVVEFS